MKPIRSEQDLIYISELLTSKFDIEGVWIKIPIPSYNLKRLDKYLFKKFMPNEKYDDSLPVTNEEIYVNIGGIQFHLCGDGVYERKVKVDEDTNQQYFDD
jgi:hypothetical protein